MQYEIYNTKYHKKQYTNKIQVEAFIISLDESLIYIHIMLKMYNTLRLSIFIQVITGIIETLTLLIKVPPRIILLQQMMLLEVIVQFIEGSFYLYWFYNFTKITNITPSRYADWVITTPTMLVNLICYYIFLQNKNLTFGKIWKQEWKTIIPILCLNWLMLLFGYLGETKVLPILTSVFLGFIPFLMYFYIIYKKYVSVDSSLFYYFFIFWALYGVAATFPYTMKNNWYNILDLFAKNFFGIYLTYLIARNFF
jgi:bacteriorhodopsin